MIGFECGFHHSTQRAKLPTWCCFCAFWSEILCQSKNFVFPMLKHRKIEIVINHDPLIGSQKCYFVCAYYPRGTSL